MPKKESQPDKGSEHLAIKHFRAWKYVLREKISLKQWKDDRLGEQFGVQSSQAAWYNARHVVETYTEAELKQLCRPRPDGKSITWDCIVALLQVKSPEDRRKLADWAYENNANAKRLTKEIRRRLGRPGSLRPGSGRKVKDPVDTQDGLDRAAAHAEALQKTLEWLSSTERGRDWTLKRNKSLTEARTAVADIQKALGRMMTGGD